MARARDVNSVIGYEIHAKEHKSPSTCDNCRDFWTLELKQNLNDTKMRIRGVPHIDVEHELTKVVAHHVLNSRLQGYYSVARMSPCREALLWEEDIIDAIRVERWDGQDYPKDIVITFSTRSKRQIVFTNAHGIQKQGYPIAILDELIPERVEIWKRAIEFFGSGRVSTFNGCVKIQTYDGQRYRMYTMQQLEALISAEKEVMISHFYGIPTGLEHLDLNVGP